MGIQNGTHAKRRYNVSFRECVSNCSVRFRGESRLQRSHSFAHLTLPSVLVEKRLFLRPCLKGVDLSSEDATISYVQDRHNIASILENIFLYLFQTGGLDQFTRAIHWLVID